MQIKDVMTTELSTVDKKSPVSEAARIMRDYDVGCVPVCEGSSPVGFLTDRDIVIRSISEELAPEDIPVEEVMSENLIYGEPEMDINEAVRLMAENQIRRLPIIENNELVGVVSLGDIATKSQYMDEASEALADISLPSRPKG